MAASLQFFATEHSTFSSPRKCALIGSSAIDVDQRPSDITWSGIKGSTACLIVLHCDAEVRWIGDTTGRVGVTVGDRALINIKGGAAWRIPIIRRAKT